MFDICLDEPKIKKSNFGQLKDALLEEVGFDNNRNSQENSKQETSCKINTDVRNKSFNMDGLIIGLTCRH